MNNPEQEITKLSSGLVVFAPKDEPLTEMQAQILNDVCERLQLAFTTLRMVHLNKDKNDPKRLHNISFTCSKENTYCGGN